MSRAKVDSVFDGANQFGVDSRGSAWTSGRFFVDGCVVLGTDASHSSAEPVIDNIGDGVSSAKTGDYPTCGRIGEFRGIGVVDDLSNRSSSFVKKLPGDDAACVSRPNVESVFVIDLVNRFFETGAVFGGGHDWQGSGELVDLEGSGVPSAGEFRFGCLVVRKTSCQKNEFFLDWMNTPRTNGVGVIEPIRLLVY